jgi:signal transduction histidine kinase
MNREAYVQEKLDVMFRYWLVRASAWGAALFLMLSALDYVSVPRYFSLFLKYRLISSSLLLLFSFAATRTSSRTVHYTLAYLAVVVSAAAIELMILRHGGHASPYYTGMILLAVSVVGFIPARFSFHATSALLIYCIYVLPIAVIERITNVEAFFTANAFMVLILVTALLMRFMTSRSLVEELGLRHDLERSREHLEDAVRDRTNELSEAVLRLQQEIAEHQRTERQLHRYGRELQERNDEFKSFVFSISHDMRAPLVNIKGFSGELGNALRDVQSLTDRCAVHLGPEDQTRLKDFTRNAIPAALGFICSASDRIEDQINSFLKLSRIGRRELVLEMIDMTALVHAVVASRSDKIMEHGVSVNIGRLPMAVADRPAMEQIVGSILDNAINYLVKGRRGIVDITGEQTDSEALFRVRDNGRGIARDDVAAVFELFRRVGPQNVPGEGMGLAYAKTLVRRHEGRIWCESEPGVGSTFCFAVPDTPALRAQAGRERTLEKETKA